MLSSLQCAEGVYVKRLLVHILQFVPIFKISESTHPQCSCLLLKMRRTMNVQTLSFRRQSSQPSGVLFAPLLVCFANFILLFFFSFIFFCLLSFVVGNGVLLCSPDGLKLMILLSHPDH